MSNSSARSAIASGSSDGKTRSASPKVSKDFVCRSTSWNSRLPSPVRKSSSPIPKPSPSEGKPSSSVSKVPSSERKPSTPVRKPSSPVRKQFPPVTKSHSSILHSPKLLESKSSIESKLTFESKPQDSELQSKLDAAVEHLKMLEEKLVSIEEEKIKAFEELNEAKRRINETTVKLQLATIAKQKAEESLETEKFVVDELVQAGIANADAYQKELKSIQEQQHYLDASALLAFSKELHKLKLELSNAINEKNSAMNETEDEENIAELNVEKVNNALFTKVGHLKSLLDSDLDMHKEAIYTIKKLNDENNALKQELGRAKLLEERLPKMEALAKQLQMEVSDMKKVESDGSTQVEELKKEVASLEASMKEANQSEKSAVETIAIMRKKMEEETSTLHDAETEIAALKRKIASLENELIKCKPDPEETDEDPFLTQQEVLCLEKTIELLKSELEKLEEEKFLLNNKVASADADLHLKEKNRHNYEPDSREDGEKTITAKESLTSTLHEISSMSTENERKLLAKQAEIEAAQLKIERFNSDIRNTKGEYDLMLDYIKYEILCLKKAIERFEAKPSNSRTECDAKELYFVNNVEKSEDELAYLKVEMVKDLNKLAEKEAHMLKEDSVDIVSKLRQAFDAAEEAKSETLQLEKKLSDNGTVLRCDTQDEELWIKPSSFLYLPNHQKCHKNGQEPTEDEDEEKRINEDGGCSMYAMFNGLIAEKDHDAELKDEGIALKTNVDNSEWTFGMTRSQLNQKKKKDFLRRFGNFLKKKKGVDIVHK